MITPSSVRRPVPATIAAVIRDGSVLLVRRANPPDVGLWGFPGGKIHFGETIAQAAVRELLEETGIQAEAGPVFNCVDVFDRAPDGTSRHHYVLIAVLCRWIAGSLDRRIAGSPVAGDDALEAAWHPLADLRDTALAMSFGVADIALQAAALGA